MSSWQTVGGGSGATILMGGSVVKSGNGTIGDRVGKQGSWLAVHGDNPALPNLYAHWDNGYVMEKLLPIDWDSVVWSDHINEVVSSLEMNFWSQPAEVDIDVDRHLQFIKSRCEMSFPEAWLPLSWWASSLHWPDKGTLIHGDPTLDNQCRRPSGELVFIDPNPATLAVPSIPLMDLANIAQSLCGYEAIKFGRPVPDIGPEFLHINLSDNDSNMLRYLTATKFVRLLAYETKYQPIFRRIARSLITG